DGCFAFFLRLVLLRLNQRDVPNSGNLPKHYAACRNLPRHSGTISGIPQLSSLLLDAPPRAFHMPGLRVGLADAEAKRELAVKLGMCEVKVATCIQPVHQQLIGRISRAQPEADEIEIGGRGEFKARIAAHPSGELLRQANVLANVMLQPLD